MKKLSFVKATIDDLDEFVHLENETFALPWSKQQLADCLLHPYLSWLVCCEGKIVGALILQFMVDECEILNLLLHPNVQGQGLGKQLLAFAFQQANQQNCQKIFLEVRESNQVAIRLYESNGFKKIGLRKNYYHTVGGGRENGLVMCCEQFVCG